MLFFVPVCNARTKRHGWPFGGILGWDVPPPERSIALCILGVLAPNHRRLRCTIFKKVVKYVTMQKIEQCAACPGGLGSALGALANQYKDSGEWLFGENGVDPKNPFSSDAIRTVVQNFRINVPPDNSYYGVLRGVSDMELGLGDSPLLGDIGLPAPSLNTLDPARIKTLARLAVQRDKSVRSYAKLSVAQRGRDAGNARPFLERMALERAAQDPVFRDLEQLASILKGRVDGAEDPLVATAKKMVSTAGSLERVHLIDQGAFRAAHLAVKDCTGPMPFSTTRRTLSAPIKGVPVIKQVCPYGRRNRTYFEAAYQNRISP